MAACAINQQWGWEAPPLTGPSTRHCASTASWMQKRRAGEKRERAPPLSGDSVPKGGSPALAVAPRVRRQSFPKASPKVIGGLVTGRSALPGGSWAESHVGGCPGEGM